MKKLGLLVAMTAALAVTSTAALAKNAPSFDFVSGSYVNVDVDGTHVGGMQFDFSKSLNENWFGTAFARHLSKGELDNTSFAAGFGYKHNLSESTALYGILALVYDDVDAGSLMNDSDTGYGVSAGVRHNFGNSFELDANIQHVDIWEDTEQNYTLSGKYYFTSEWAVKAGYTHVDSDVSMTFVGFSYEF
ncbi:outer membrane beta-barrel protein [Pseudidiomarina sp.]|uniref:outer membrane beta-barrel protein n=1 Tax=Pseudidiomarina sp. TaxID=2081707 RepID=UPI00299DC8D1|nr:outer membrane beta-barrel protein [Pseudidiomarina sp.]MDX1706872.1 outer membrane beta-barrel protein [Pseudidiomarina sp.]